jgi:hypothetical protein
MKFIIAILIIGFISVISYLRAIHILLQKILEKNYDRNENG